MPRWWPPNCISHAPVARHLTVEPRGAPTAIALIDEHIAAFATPSQIGSDTVGRMGTISGALVTARCFTFRDRRA